MTASGQSVGLKIETTYGTPVTVDRWYEVTSESLRLDAGRARGASMRANQRTQRTDRFMPFKTGVSGGITLDVPTKGFGRVLDGIFGASSVATVVDSNYIQTHTLGSLIGNSYTVQVNRPLVDTTDTQFTYHGVKFQGATFSCDVDGVLTCDLECIGEDVDTSTGLAAASYQTCHVFTFTGGSMTVAGTATPVRDYSISIRNNMSTRRMVRGSALTLEPLETGFREIEVSFTAEFTSLTDYNRYISATSAGALASVIGTFTGPILGGTTATSLAFTTPNLDFTDADGPYLNGLEIPTVSFTGLALYDGSSEAVTATYTTTDSAI